MKLISMTEFVLDKWPEATRISAHSGWWYSADDIQIMKNYANFLKQPLALGMFVPCDEEGNVLKKPHYMDFFLGGEYEPHEERYKICEQYQQAKERVLFKLGGQDMKPKDIDGHFMAHMGSPVESFVGLNYELTPTALKQIGL